MGFPTGLYPVGCEGRIHYKQVLENGDDGDVVVHRPYNRSGVGGSNTQHG